MAPAGQIPGDGTLWGTTDPGATTYWNQNVAPQMPTCPGNQQPTILEHNGSKYPTCISQGVFYAPPFLQAVLAELLWPQAWSLIPPG